MAYESVDQLQKVLAESVFHDRKDAKKASGRALGTLVEIVTFYLLKSWGFERSVAIERRLAEYGNPEITHNVEYSLHPIIRETSVLIPGPRLPLTPSRILSAIDEAQFSHAAFARSGNTLLTSARVLRNSCVIATAAGSHLVATVEAIGGDFQVVIVEQASKPYAILECKRVGIEEGMKKGPQTIEKAKQGAYVARAVSSLQKVRTGSGEKRGLLIGPEDEIYAKPYDEFLAEIVDSERPELLRDFILTVGVVSNHGNWFTSDNHNKELKVLAESYDWLLFLTDEGLSEFITELLLSPAPLLSPARETFLASYAPEKKRNQFTKVQMGYEADQVLQAYFRDNRHRVATWFNVIAPEGRAITALQAQMSQLRDKNWRMIHGI